MLIDVFRDQYAPGLVESVNIHSNLLHLGAGLEAPASWLNTDGSFQASFARMPRTKAFLVALGIYPRQQAQIPWPTNVLRVNFNKPLPFASDRFEAIYSSHTFEHLYRDAAASLARECFRVLKPGGICRVLVPDLEAAVARYQARQALSSANSTSADQLLDELMLQPRSTASGALAWYHRYMNLHQHKWMYDQRSLSALLDHAGFSALKVYRARDGELPELTAIENPSRIVDGAGVAVEGRKIL